MFKGVLLLREVVVYDWSRKGKGFARGSENRVRVKVTLRVFRREMSRGFLGRATEEHMVCRCWLKSMLSMKMMRVREAPWGTPKLMVEQSD